MVLYYTDISTMGPILRVDRWVSAGIVEGVCGIGCWGAIKERVEEVSDVLHDCSCVVLHIPHDKSVLELCLVESCLIGVEEVLV